MLITCGPLDVRRVHVCWVSKAITVHELTSRSYSSTFRVSHTQHTQAYSKLLRLPLRADSAVHENPILGNAGGNKLEINVVQRVFCREAVLEPFFSREHWCDVRLPFSGDGAQGTQVVHSTIASALRGCGLNIRAEDIVCQAHGAEYQDETNSKQDRGHESLDSIFHLYWVRRVYLAWGLLIISFVRMDEELLSACRAGSAARCRRALDSGSNPNCLDKVRHCDCLLRARTDTRHCTMR